MPATDFNKLSKELSGSSGFFGSFLLFIIIALVAILLFWANVTELDNVTSIDPNFRRRCDQG